MKLTPRAFHSLTAGRLVVFLSSTDSSLALPPQLSLGSVPQIFLQVAQYLPATLLWLNCQNQDSLLTFTPSFLFSPASGTNFLTLFNPTPPSRTLKQLFTTISYLPPSKTLIFSTPANFTPNPLFRNTNFFPGSPWCPCVLYFSHPLPTPPPPQALSLSQISRCPCSQMLCLCASSSLPILSTAPSFYIFCLFDLFV